MHATGAIVSTAAAVRRAHAIMKAHGPERAVRFLESVARHPNRYTTTPTSTAGHSGSEKATG